MEKDMKNKKDLMKYKWNKKLYSKTFEKSIPAQSDHSIIYENEMRNTIKILREIENRRIEEARKQREEDEKVHMICVERAIIQKFTYNNTSSKVTVEFSKNGNSYKQGTFEIEVNHKNFMDKCGMFISHSTFNIYGKGRIINKNIIKILHVDKIEKV